MKSNPARWAAISLPQMERIEGHLCPAAAVFA
jgi:hypothetical protein